MPMRGVVILTKSVDSEPTARSGVADKSSIPAFGSYASILLPSADSPYLTCPGSWRRKLDERTYCPIVRILRPLCCTVMEEIGKNNAD